MFLLGIFMRGKEIRDRVWFSIVMHRLSILMLCYFIMLLLVAIVVQIDWDLLRRIVIVVFIIAKGRRGRAEASLRIHRHALQYCCKSQATAQRVLLPVLFALPYTSTVATASDRIG